MNVKQEIKDRVSNKTIGSRWKKARNICGIIAMIGGFVLFMPISLPASVISWVYWITSVSGALAARGHLDKSKKN